MYIIKTFWHHDQNDDSWVRKSSNMGRILLKTSLFSPIAVYRSRPSKNGFARLDGHLWKNARLTPVFLWFCSSFCDELHVQSVIELFAKCKRMRCYKIELGWRISKTGAAKLISSASAGVWSLQQCVKSLCSLQMTEATQLNEATELQPVRHAVATQMNRLLQAAAVTFQVCFLLYSCL